MKNKMIFMIFAVSLLLNISCTNDEYDDEEIKATNPKNIKVIPSNTIEANGVMVIDSLGNNYNTLVEDPEGDPSNPKIKE